QSDEVIVGVGSPFLLSWMQKQFRPKIAEAARDVLGPSARVRFEVDSELASSLESRAPAGPIANSTDPGPDLPKEQPAAPAKDSTYRPGRQFARLEDFIDGTHASLAMTAIHEICTSPGRSYNPLYLHGGVGLGKTHLLEGVYRA